MAAAPQFRAKNQDLSTSTSKVWTEPAGTVEGDILFVHMVWASASAWAFTDWNLVYSHARPSSTTRLYWLRRGASAPNLTISWTGSTYFDGSISSWSGAKTSGTPFASTENTSPTTRNPSNPDCPSITTPVANCTVIAFGMGWTGWDAGGATPPAGYTLRHGATVAYDTGIASKEVASAGAEDPGAFANNGPAANSDVSEITVALEPPLLVGADDYKPHIWNVLHNPR